MSQRSILRGSDRFRIDREIADTLQGRIYAGTDLLTDKAVVIKEAWRQLVHSGRSRKGHRVPEDFLKERKLIMSLTSLPDCTPGLVRGIDEWDDEHCYYYAMEFCEGELFDYISSTHTQTDYRQFVDIESKKEQIPMTTPNKWVKNIAKMFKQICEAVQWLHSKGYCHLDLSLENTMISDIKNLKVKIIDLGLTQKFNNNDFRFQGRVGKLQYMCPEAYARQIYNAKAADVYCLGVMLFMMLVGAPPYQAPQTQNAAFTYFVSGRAAHVLKHWKRLRLISVDALDLLNNMLRYENNRITLDKILKHPFFAVIDEDEKDKEKEVIEENINSNMQISDALHHAMDDDHKEKENENEKENEINIWCEMLLQEWGLDDISSILHSSGWSDPKQWNQLTKSALKFEIGLTDQQASLFIKHIKQEFTIAQQQNQCNTSNRPNQQQQKRQKQQKQQKYRRRPNIRTYNPQQQQQQYRHNQYNPHQHHQFQPQRHRRQQQQPHRQHNPHQNHPNPYSQYNNDDNNNDNNNDNDNDNDNNNNNPNHRQHPNPHQQHKHPH